MKIGHRNGKLITLEKLGGRPCLWKCKCDCGQEKIIKEIHLYTHKGVTSCGCVGRKRFGKDRFTKEFIKERIEVDKNDCWIWKGAKHRQGYGSIRFNGKTSLSHRLSWIIFRGEISESMKVCHTCDIPSCVNPDHLFLGTQTDNIEDCQKKGRFTRNIPKTRRIKLNWNQVQEIKKLSEQGMTRKELEKKFEVSQTCIAKILTGKSWNINWTEEN